MEFWQVLAMRRREIGMRYDVLSEKSCIPVNTLKKVLTGMVPGASFESIRRISVALDMNLAELEYRLMGMESPDQADQLLLRRMQGLDQHGRAVVNAVLDLELDRVRGENVSQADGVYPLPDHFALNPVPLIGEANCGPEKIHSLAPDHRPDFIPAK